MKQPLYLLWLLLTFLGVGWIITGCFAFFLRNAGDSAFVWMMLLITVTAVVLGVVGMIRTMRLVERMHEETRRVRAESHERHRRAMHEQQEKQRIKKQLTNNINHELKTPVGAIHLCLETLREHPGLDEDTRRSLMERCYTNSVRLMRLLADVSTITRLDDGAADIERSPLCLGELIRECVDDAGQALRDKGITVNFLTDTDTFSPDSTTDEAVSMPMRGSESLLRSVFANLLNNAVAYSECSVITINTCKRDGFYRIGFHDNGIGIPQEHLPHIFERFYRIDKGRSRSCGGTGLGLAIVKNVVTLHGGTISATRPSAGGLLFVINLPVG